MLQHYFRYFTTSLSFAPIKQSELLTPKILIFIVLITYIGEQSVPRGTDQFHAQFKAEENKMPYCYKLLRTYKQSSFT